MCKRSGAGPLLTTVACRPDSSNALEDGASGKSAILGGPKQRQPLPPTSVSDPHPARMPNKEDKRTFLRKLAEFLHPGPDSTEELIETLAEAEDNNIIGAESRVMLEGVIRMADMTAGDVMVAATRMDLLNIQAPMDELLHTVIHTAHSRFPVYEGERENVIGILLAKDLLKLQRAPEFHIRALLRPPVFVPETKGLNEGDIFALADHTYRVSGDTPIERVNDAFTVTLAGSDPDDEFDTIGGLIAHEMGHVPKRGERYTLCGLDFTVLHTKGGAVRWFKVAPAVDSTY